MLPCTAAGGFPRPRLVPCNGVPLHYGVLVTSTQLCTVPSIARMLSWQGTVHFNHLVVTSCIHVHRLTSACTTPDNN